MIHIPTLSGSRFFRLLCLILCFALSQAASASSPSTENTGDRRTHTIRKGETLFRLTQIYHVSAQAICRANPGLSAENFPIGKEIIIPTPAGLTSSAQAAPEKPLRVALLLPFGLDNPLPESSRMLEFYEGFLLALDTLKQRGYSVHLDVYDTGGEGTSLKPLLDKPELRQADLLIGGYHWGHIKQLSDFSRSHRIKMVLPFSSNDHFVESNPYLYMANTPQVYLYPSVLERFELYFADVHVFFLDTEQNKDDKRQLVSDFKDYFQREKITYETVAPGTTSTQLARRLKKRKVNLFFPVSGKKAILEEWMPTLATLRKDVPNREMQLFGYPEWQTYAGQFVLRFHALDTYIYSAFYTHPDFPSARRFNEKFRQWFHRNPAPGYPSYSMLGYDLALSFLLPEGAPEIPALQNGFEFAPLGGNNAGYVNRCVYFIHYSPDMEVIKTALQ